MPFLGQFCRPLRYACATLALAAVAAVALLNKPLKPASLRALLSRLPLETVAAE